MGHEPELVEITHFTYVCCGSARGGITTKRKKSDKSLCFHYFHYPCLRERNVHRQYLLVHFGQSSRMTPKSDVHPWTIFAVVIGRSADHLFVDGVEDFF